MHDEQAFLAALAAQPADDVTRVVYADWLEEHGQPDRAEYLRLECRLAKMRRADEGHAEIDRRLRELRGKTDATWRVAAGRTYALVLESFERPYKIWAIKVARELTGGGLTQSKVLVESAPFPLLIGLSFEGADHGRRELVTRPSPFVHRLIDTPGPPGPRAVTAFVLPADAPDVIACREAARERLTRIVEEQRGGYEETSARNLLGYLNGSQRLGDGGAPA